MQKLFKKLLMNKEELLEFKQEVIDWLKLLFSLSGIWVFIPAILAIVYVYIAKANNWDDTLIKGTHETIALWLMSIATGIMLIRIIFYHYHLDIILFVLAVAFLCREIHFTGTHKGIYIAAGIIGFWSYCWRKQLFADFATSRIMRIVFMGMIWSYFLALLVQRRAFKRILPKEKHFHVPMEEVGENVAHLSFILVAILCFTLRHSPSEKPPEKEIDSSSNE